MSNANIHVPERFRRIIALHIVKNLIDIPQFRIPLILGIHGPSGEGKTFQCEYVLSEMGVKTFLISAGQLESGTAGDPAKLIRETYENASKAVQKDECKAAVVLINDVDTGLGDWGEKVQTTINTQTVYGELMHLVDYPHSVAGRATRRIPLILTGNDFTKLYAPLVRAGRMVAFEWSPTTQEKIDIVSRMFPEIDFNECRKLVDEFPNEPVSFFAHLRATLIDEVLWKEIQKANLSKIVAYINDGHQPEIKLVVKSDLLIQAGKDLQASGQLINHLKGKRK